ncbi:MAG: hypothetical protein FWG10_06625 [Eubacteriaceae bacterium]|nr:hypothetical protein [Eubacteriaceae bacterium]
MAIKFCVNCGSKMLPEHKYCNNCGTPAFVDEDFGKISPEAEILAIEEPQPAAPEDMYRQPELQEQADESQETELGGGEQVDSDLQVEAGEVADLQTNNEYVDEEEKNQETQPEYGQGIGEDANQDILEPEEDAIQESWIHESLESEPKDAWELDTQNNHEPASTTFYDAHGHGSQELEGQDAKIDKALLLLNGPRTGTEADIVPELSQSLQTPHSQNKDEIQLQENTPEPAVKKKIGKKFLKTLGIAAAVLVIALVFIINSLKNTANADFYKLGKDRIPSIKLVCGERESGKIEKSASGGITTITIEHTSGNPVDDLLKYTNRLTSIEDFVFTTEFNPTASQGSIQLATDSVDNGKIILIDFDYGDTGYTITIRKGKGTLSRF